MKAVVIRSFGNADVLEHEELVRPDPRPGHVIMRIEAVGTNYYDILVRSGIVSRDIALPHIPGSDAAGIVEEVGPGVTSFGPGDRVIAAPGYPTQPSEWTFTRENEAPSYFPTGTFENGTYTQYMEIHERWLVRDETGLSFEEAASLPLVLVTAVNAVRTKGEVRPGARVLVQGGASGSGSMAIQVAKALGAHVITTVSTEVKARLARRMGADEVIFYKEQNVADSVRSWSSGEGVDLVIDPIGGTTFADSINSLRPRGMIVNFGLIGGIEATIPNHYVFFRNELQVKGSWMGSMEELRFGLDLVRKGAVRAAIDQVLPLGAAREAHAMIEAGSVSGKLVLQPWA